MLADARPQLRALKEGLNVPVEKIDRNAVMPIFVPASLFALGNWPGPFTRLRCPEIGLTWTVLMPNQTMRYVNFEMQQLWESEGLDWKDLAMKNLGARSQSQPGLFEMRRADGTVYAISCMFWDGLGPSRLLFRGTLSQTFPDGYRVAIPEMSCGIAYSATVSEAEKTKVEGIIDDCYRKGTRPMAPGTYDADSLLPA